VALQDSKCQQDNSVTAVTAGCQAAAAELRASFGQHPTTVGGANLQ